MKVNKYKTTFWRNFWLFEIPTFLVCILCYFAWKPGTKFIFADFPEISVDVDKSLTVIDWVHWVTDPLS